MDPHSSKNQRCAVFWFRRDLRFDDNEGLFHALNSGLPVRLIFIFDMQILAKLPRRDARVQFIQQQLETMNQALKGLGAALSCYQGSPEDVWTELFATLNIQAVFCNEDYEPYARQRDAKIKKLAESHGAEFKACKDQVIFATDEVVKEDGKPYVVFTPYARKWKTRLFERPVKSVASKKLLNHLAPIAFAPIPTLKKLGFEDSEIAIPDGRICAGQIKEYAAHRNFMGEHATTRLGLHLRFGTVSVRHLVNYVQKLSETFLNELIWREFFMQILYHFPHTVSEPFDSRFKNVKWRNSKVEFKKWCEGETGYPIVDAGMRELNKTGFMHNRARMITASFLTKHLLIDWRWGERYFAERLLDFELSSNVGNWQWAAGCGCDAAPYFRIFNPSLQAKKFDSAGKYVEQWAKDIQVAPMVDHATARKRALVVIARAVKKQNY